MSGPGCAGQSDRPAIRTRPAHTRDSREWHSDKLLDPPGTHSLLSAGDDEDVARDLPLVDGAYLTTAWAVSVMLSSRAIFFLLFTLPEDFG